MSAPPHQNSACPPPVAGKLMNGPPIQQQQQFQTNNFQPDLTNPKKIEQNYQFAPSTIPSGLQTQPNISAQYPPPPAFSQPNASLQSQLPPRMQMINGTNSSHSSRTASPALNNSVNQNKPGNRINYPPVPVPMVQPSSSNLISPTNANAVTNLSGSMQNLALANMNKSNGPLPPPPTSIPNNLQFSQQQQQQHQHQQQQQQHQQQQQQQQQQHHPQQQQQARPPVQYPARYQFEAAPQLNPAYPVSQNNVVYPPPGGPSGNVNQIGNNYGKPMNLSNPSMPLPPPPSKLGYPPTSNVSYNQNALNNNSQPSNMGNQPMPPPPTNIKKPMYPPAPVQTQAYSQPQQNLVTNNYDVPQPGMQQNYQSTFNGQPNTGQLQYQAGLTQQMSVTQQGFNRLWGQDTVDLMQHRHILTSATLQTPRIVLNNQFHESVNVNPDIMRCTLTRIPESNNLLQKSRLPLGLLIHPFRDVNNLPVIQCPNIVRCRLCRTYINPFVYFVDSKMWKCNLCYRVNELPDDFQYDPATKTYGDVTRRPEVRSSTIEFIAPSEYMLRPPQPAIYLFMFDVSILAQQSGYLETACSVISKYIEDMPGDARTQVGFIAYNSAIHFYNIAESYNQPHEMSLVDIDDPFLPCPDNLLINLKECKELIKDLLNQLPTRFADTHDPDSCLGAALQVAYKLMMQSGGRVTVFQTCLPNKGAGALQAREDPNNRSSKEVNHLNPATDFYKRHALECSGYQIAVDLFVLNQQYVDLATVSGIAKHSGGSVHHFPLYQKTKPQHVDAFKQCLKRYLVRKIGFEAVMRIRCTRGLQVHTFHGNFFVRSTDLLSLPNVNPDAGYGMQISYEEQIADVKTVCFQAALLYTNSEGERRIRVHTLCLPITSNLNEVMHSADSHAIIGLLSKMAVDRSLASNLSDAREAFINATVDILSAFKVAQNLPSGQTGQLMAPKNLALLPLYILALLKHPAFRVGTSTRLDDRVDAMNSMKTLPLDQLMKCIYPEFYIIDCLFQNTNNENEEDPPFLQLSAEYLDSRSMFLLDCGSLIVIYVGLNVPPKILENVLGIQSTAELPDYCYGLVNINTPENEALQNFINQLNEEKPYLPTIQIIRDTSTSKMTLIEKLIDDRSESSFSYYEFIQHLRTQVK